MGELFLDDGDIRLYHGDVLEVLAGMPDESVDCVVTSPPYWGLRDYQTGSWDGGEPECDHIAGRGGHLAESAASTRGGAHKVEEAQTVPFKDVCGKCGARRVDQQLGLEATPDLFVSRMVDVFRHVRRVLAAHGTCWVNLGDSYASRDNGTLGANSDGKQDRRREHARRSTGTPPGLKHKDLVGIPWRVAFALQADGWWLRSAITWCKPNCMPESVTDRPTKATEMIFLLTKAPRYYYDADAVREKSESSNTDAARRTNGAASGGATLRPEVSATLSTDNGTTNTGGWCDLGELQVPITSAVADKTERLQVLQPVGLYVGVETPEGPLVVDLERRGLAAVDAAMPVSLASGLSLLSPVWASVVDASPTPSGAVLSCHVGSDPDPAALARAEVTSLEMACVAGEWLAATVTLDGEGFGATLLVWGTARPTHTTNTSESGRNQRDWWVLPTQPYPEAHFATYPEELVRRCVLAGTSEKGKCPECGAPWERDVDAETASGSPVRKKPKPLGAWLRQLREAHGIRQSDVAQAFPSKTGGLTGCVSNWELDRNVPTSQQWGVLKSLLGFGDERDGDLLAWHEYERSEWGKTPDALTHGAPSAAPASLARRVTGETWVPTCQHDHEPIPCVVLDPFAGSGTTCKVARDHGRHSIGIDLSADYLGLAARRLQQLSLLT